MCYATDFTQRVKEEHGIFVSLKDILITHEEMGNINRPT